MNAITLKNLSDQASLALEARAAAKGTTVEAEAERILTDALQVFEDKGEPVQGDEPEVGLGTALRRLAQKYPELADIDFSRDQTPAWTDTSE